jgi:hypothetical protein
MSDILTETQKEVARLRDMISTTKALLPNGKGIFVIYEVMIDKAEKAIREHDTTELVKLLPELKEMQ